jgi:hypothetical protein
MEMTSTTKALLETMKILKRYIHFKDQSSYLILGLFILQTHCFKNFDTLPYLLITGPYGSGKTLILELLNILCHRPLLASQISKAAFYHVIHRLQGTLLIDEAEGLSQRYQNEFDMAVLLHGYKAGGFVVRVDPGKRKHIKFRCFGPKVIANIGGISSKQLKSRCIILKTIEMEVGTDMKTFITSRDGGQLKELASAIASLFKRKKINEQIKSLYHNFKSIEGLKGRDLELWIGMLVLAQIIDSEAPNLKLYDRVVKTAISATEKRDEEIFFKDWNAQFIMAAESFFPPKYSDSDTFIQADLITKHVIEKVNPPFPLRTEGLGRILDRESILIERRVRWFKDEKGNPVHKTGWRIDFERLRRKISKFQKYIEPKEDPLGNQVRSIYDIVPYLR